MLIIFDGWVSSFSVDKSVFYKWKKDVWIFLTFHCKTSLQAAESLADPTEYENLFPGLKEAFAAEHYLRESCLGSSRPAKDYPLVTVSCVSWQK